MNPNDWLSEIYTSDTGWEHLENLVSIGGRLPGSGAERRAAKQTADVFKSIGIGNVFEETYAITGWQRGRSSIKHIETNSEYRCLALPRSPSVSATGSLVDVGYGLPETFENTDVADQIVVVAAGVPENHDRYVHRMEKYRCAVEQGAAAFLFRSTRDGDLPMTGSLGSPDGALGEIPGVAVSKEVGLELVRRHESTPIEVITEAEIGPATSQNVHARIGPGTDERILLTSHLDAHDLGVGAVDNGTGTAVLVEVMRSLVQSDITLEVDVEAIAFGSEEINLVGSEHTAESIPSETIRAIINLDGVAQGRELEVYPHGFDPIEEAVETIESDFGQEITTSEITVPFSDHWPFAKRGVPTCFVTATTEALRGWGHTHGDTLDKVDRRDFREHAVLVSGLVQSLATTQESVPHRPREEVVAKLEQEGQLEGLEAMGWGPNE